MIFVISRERRRWQTLVGMLALLIALTSGALACGGGGGGSGGGGKGNPGTTPGNYTITITGISGTLTENGTVTLTVN
jgi:hypothetical protein